MGSAFNAEAKDALEQTAGAFNFTQ